MVSSSNNNLVKQCKSEERGPHAPDMLKTGGQWLGSARNWIQSNAHNGDSVDWGSDKFLQLKGLTVRDIEYFAAQIAAATLQEFKHNLATDGETRALKDYQNRDNWRTARDDDSSNGELGLCVFDPDRDKMHFQSAFMHENGWDLVECVDEPEKAKARKWPKENV